MNRFIVVDTEHAGMRLDVFLTRYLPPPCEAEGWSRSAVQKMIVQGEVALNGGRSKPSARLKPGDRIEIQALPPREAPLTPEALPLNILYEDEDCIVVNKEPGMVVHPAAGRTGGTLVNAVLHHCPDLPGIGGEKRPGIVHRLDKDTSGVIVIAKNDLAFRQLSRQFRERRVGKEYLALVWGKMEKERGLIDRPIGRHRSDRKRMSSVRSLARVREAITEWRIEEMFQIGTGRDRFSSLTLLRLSPLTGRTHQIRVHLADQGHPVVGDRVYGRRPPQESPPIGGLIDFPRQALHAERLRFRHPRSGELMECRAPLPPDMQRLLETLSWARGARKTEVGVDKKARFS